ncbi:MAG: hypothetical protein Q9213_007486, partial [Squamulea squamosa]
MKATTTLPRLSSTLSKPKICIRHPRPQKLLPPTQCSFLSSSTLTPLQTLTASRILPYRQSDLYNIITDIPSYPSFLPYCKSAQITSHSSPDPSQNKQWPHTATLNVGWGAIDESFTSRIYCLPYHTLEACAGSASPTIPKSNLPHYQNISAPSEEETPLFTSLLTRWKLSEFPFKPLPPSDQSPQEGDAEANPSHPRTE